MNPKVPEISTSCDENGVINVSPGIAGLMQANLIIQFLIGASHDLRINSMLPDLFTHITNFNLINMKFKQYTFKRKPGCICNSEKFQSTISLNNLLTDIASTCRKEQCDVISPNNFIVKYKKH